MKMTMGAAATVMIIMVVIISPYTATVVESLDFNCYDGCITACVQRNSRLVARCEGKCNIRCNQGVSTKAEEQHVG